LKSRLKPRLGIGPQAAGRASRQLPSREFTRAIDPDPLA
jgi:hypothetical protein